MKGFIFKLLLFTSPLLIYLVFIIIKDPFKIIYKTYNYNEETFVALNRGHICTNIFNNNRKTIKYNSFIFGNSRSIAFKCEKWNQYLDNDAISFHYDGAFEGIYGINKKVKYIDSLNYNIDNALIIIDREVMTKTSNDKRHLYTLSPELINSSYLSFFKKHINVLLNYKFIFGYIDYTLFGSYKNYMKGVFLNEKNKDSINHINADIYRHVEKEIKNDSLEYYKKVNHTFFKRRNITKSTKITNKEIDLLNEINIIFKKCNTNYKIVISPLYEQIPLDSNQLNLLYKIFGKENIYNYSGNNKLTEYKYNYYESSHYRNNVANIILSEIYSTHLQID